MTFSFWNYGYNNIISWVLTASVSRDLNIFRRSSYFTVNLMGLVLYNRCLSATYSMVWWQVRQFLEISPGDIILGRVWPKGCRCVNKALLMAAAWRDPRICSRKRRALMSISSESAQSCSCPSSLSQLFLPCSLTHSSKVFSLPLLFSPCCFQESV